MEIGIDSFAAKFNSDTSNAASDAIAMVQLLERIEHADKTGLDSFGRSEEHTSELQSQR